MNKTKGADEKIPCFDGTTPFFLEKFWKLPKIDTEIESCSAVLILFSVSTYDYKGSLCIPNLHTNTSLNVISIVLLASPTNDYTNSLSRKPPTTYTKKQLGIEDVAEEKTIASTSQGPMMCRPLYLYHKYVFVTNLQSKGELGTGAPAPLRFGSRVLSNTTGNVRMYLPYFTQDYAPLKLEESGTMQK
ncbi:hypothetical protein K503DRAFT_779829 [Rhizopogon vinicolor AM-OR11-026]|uniref:Uncharacterized protein n=1 Tax=Rhizopogon vinicolor AM-OR11-026 TaxID=1314800 RepID=A0A1B7NCM9_9AGAM|nr:hypothetical protein K503DRAFT_779829 [Rhizopogon vinicolor AM-OR11-026]